MSEPYSPEEPRGRDSEIEKTESITIPEGWTEHIIKIPEDSGLVKKRWLQVRPIPVYSWRHTNFQGEPVGSQNLEFILPTPPNERHKRGKPHTVSSGLVSDPDYIEQRMRENLVGLIEFHEASKEMTHNAEALEQDRREDDTIRPYFMEDPNYTAEQSALEDARNATLQGYTAEGLGADAEEMLREIDNVENPDKE
jgi:hypothetical protein